MGQGSLPRCWPVRPGNSWSGLRPGVAERKSSLCGSGAGRAQRGDDVLDSCGLGGTYPLPVLPVRGRDLVRQVDHEAPVVVEFLGGRLVLEQGRRITQAGQPVFSEHRLLMMRGAIRQPGDPGIEVALACLAARYLRLWIGLSARGRWMGDWFRARKHWPRRLRNAR